MPVNGNPENLKPFPPGVSGNPRGRPRGRSVSALLRALAEDTEISGLKIPRGKAVADAIAEVIVRKALGGDPRFMNIFLDRTDGKVPDRHEVTGGDGGPVRITIVEVVRPAPRDGDPEG